MFLRQGVCNLRLFYTDAIVGLFFSIFLYQRNKFGIIDCKKFFHEVLSATVILSCHRRWILSMNWPMNWVFVIPICPCLFGLKNCWTKQPLLLPPWQPNFPHLLKHLLMELSSQENKKWYKTVACTFQMVLRKSGDSLVSKKNCDFNFHICKNGLNRWHSVSVICPMCLCEDEHRLPCSRCDVICLDIFWMIRAESQN